MHESKKLFMWNETNVYDSSLFMLILFYFILKYSKPGEMMIWLAPLQLQIIDQPICATNLIYK